jgi:hypothetical protein
MAAISLNSIPNDLHIEVKMYQLELEKKGQKLTLEQIYIQLVEIGLKSKKPDQK